MPTASRGRFRPSPTSWALEGLALFERVARRIGVADPAAADSTMVGRYRLGQQLGKGGMGVVYLGHDPELSRDVAIKLVGAVPLVSMKRLKTRLQREAQMLAKLVHDNVVRVYDVGEHRGELFVAMEYVHGVDLGKWQKAGPRSRAEILDIYLAAGAGLAAAHEAGVIHRDFKPENVLVGKDGRVRVSDFGLAHLHDEPTRTESTDSSPAPADPRLTRTDEVVGTLAYMAPEQLRNTGLDARSDQFAYCVAMWEAVSGKRPYVGEKADALLAAIDSGRREGGEQLPRWLRRTLERGMAAEPGQRFESMKALLEVLRKGARARNGGYAAG
ncbi:MAG: serine/threonine protein kinase [Deltaproteobacteria bacterium]|nr:serine/threonine protein kinase [Deltaproteobacteria bacterium]